MKSGSRVRAPAPGTWTLKRGLILIWLCVHWAVLILWVFPEQSVLPNWARPAADLRDRVLDYQTCVPHINTHKGQFGVAFGDWQIGSTPETDRMGTGSPLMAYLAWTCQGQAWQMFTPRSPYAFRMRLVYHLADGSQRSRWVADLERLSIHRWQRWRSLEWALIEPEGQRNYLPVAGLAIAERLEDEPLDAASVELIVSLVPSLEKDDSDSPLFTSSAEYEARVQDPERRTRVQLRRYWWNGDAP